MFVGRFVGARGALAPMNCAWGRRAGCFTRPAAVSSALGAHQHHPVVGAHLLVATRGDHQLRRRTCPSPRAPGPAGPRRRTARAAWHRARLSTSTTRKSSSSRRTRWTAVRRQASTMLGAASPAASSTITPMSLSARPTAALRSATTTRTSGRSSRASSAVASVRRSSLSGAHHGSRPPRCRPSPAPRVAGHRRPGSRPRGSREQRCQPDVRLVVDDDRRHPGELQLLHEPEPVVVQRRTRPRGPRGRSSRADQGSRAPAQPAAHDVSGVLSVREQLQPMPPRPGQQRHREDQR